MNSQPAEGIAQSSILIRMSLDLSVSLYMNVYVR